MLTGTIVDVVTALYRRYRPESFGEMIGQNHVTEPLLTALQKGRVGHAYLFSGPRGCGKTSSARILARCLNCVEGPTPSPCGTCESCVELGRGGSGSLDVIEIDAASHGRVDDARDLRDRAAFSPARDRFKIFIIDEAHMVTSAGFNALLKIVEEPPEHIKFIFATTEPEKVIGTIRSRTHHYMFRLVAPNILTDYVESVCVSEGVKCEPGVVPMVVKAGGGSVRDTLSILDQLIAGSEETVLLQHTTGLLGFTRADHIDELLHGLAARDAAAVFHAVENVMISGSEPRRLVEDVLERLRDLIVLRAAGNVHSFGVFRGVPEAALEEMRLQAKLFSGGELTALAVLAGETLDEMRGAVAPRLQLELLLARLLFELGSKSDSVKNENLAQTQAQGQGPAKLRGADVQSAPQPVLQAAEQPQVHAAKQPAIQKPANVTQTAPGTAEIAAKTPGFGKPVASVLQEATPAGVSAGESVLNREQVTGEPVATAQTTAAATVTQGHTADNTAVNIAQNDADGDVFKQLQELWPTLLEELEQADVSAWRSVKDLTPVKLEDEILSIGCPSSTHLENFKRDGAAPLRELLEGALAITVKYLPCDPPKESSISRADRLLEGLGPALAAPGWANPDAAPGAVSIEVPADTVSSERTDLNADASSAAVNAAEHSTPAHSTQMDGMQASGGELTQTQSVTQQENPQDAPKKTPQTTPQTAPQNTSQTASQNNHKQQDKYGKPASKQRQKYGETVIREKLHARFIEEHALNKNE